MQTVGQSRPRGSVRRHRGAARGSLVGVGLLLATTTSMPAALATDDELPEELPGEEQPETAAPSAAPLVDAPPLGAATADGATLAAPTLDAYSAYFGTGKLIPAPAIPVTTQGAVPAGLDLSGTEFTLTAPGPGGATFTCTTARTGAGTDLCSFDEEAQPPAGTYALTQTGTVTGLEGAAGIGTVEICEVPFPTGSCGETVAPAVVNGSLFRTRVLAKVPTPVATEPVRYELVGPAGQPDTGDGRAAAATTGVTRWGPADADPDGLVDFAGYFAPGATFTVRAVDLAGVDQGEVVPAFTIAAPTVTGAVRPASWPVWLAGGAPDPEAPPAPPVADPPTPSPAPTTAPTTAPAPARAAAPAPARPSAGPAPVPDARTAPAAGAAAAGSTTPPSVSTGSPSPRTTAPATPSPATVEAQPLETVGSTAWSMPVIGVGLAVLAAGIGGLGYLARRRARRG
ncbi:hypothetical protein [Blastococcus tunisiensis]|uniref:Uncharacterized protein n=1 Tax=Blastococcus tunisiensis TaxID=1798228 RepID=A0A1I1Z9H0_9ACTN|nr:hypothetical protein [Blastococcus sp. DSM 46838]SFE28192.1 hypothetical protein SAMN05216574_10313 [Blastococcus sp. DSM 46838]